MNRKHKGSKQGNFTSRMPAMHVAQLVRLEELGLAMQQNNAAPSANAILVRATQHILDTSRRECGFWNRTGIVTSESTNAKTAVIYVLADEELHLITLGGTEVEVQQLLAGARRSGHLDVLWATPKDRRLSRIAFDECLGQVLNCGAGAVKSDTISLMYDVVRAAQYALSHDVLRRVGIDPDTVHRQVVHFLATPAMLNEVDQLARSVKVTKH